MVSVLKQKVFWEVIVVFATVLIFRSAWTLMDKIEFLMSDIFLLTSLVVGILVSAIALYKMHCCKT